MKWYIPSWNGDLRLVSHTEDANKTILSIVDPTPDERAMLERMGKAFLEKGFVKTWAPPEGGDVVLDAALATVGPIVTGVMRPGPAVLTAVVYKDGLCKTTYETGAALESFVKEAEGTPSEDAKSNEAAKPNEDAKSDSGKGKKAKAEAAATVRRPTPSCPQCEVGAIQPASEVLLSFLNAEEHATWARDRFIIVEGGMSGHRYLLAHRKSPLAARIGRICYDLDTKCVVHFHDWRVPPEEEILAAKLILEHAEPWLRNEATMFQRDARMNALIFKNPFGDLQDGIPDARFTEQIGTVVLGAASGMAVAKALS